MGKVWPPDSVAFNQATTTLSTITALDESPLLEGLILAGTDDGLVQITEDGGKAWRRIEQFPGVPEHTYVTDVYASPRDSNASSSRSTTICAAISRRTSCAAPIAGGRGHLLPATFPHDPAPGPSFRTT